MVRLLKNEYGCDTVIFFGSRARGNEDFGSDYDFIGIGNKEELIHENRIWNGLYLDLFIYSQAEVERLILPENLNFLVKSHLIGVEGGKILTQKNEMGTRLMARIREVYRDGPPLTSEEEIQFLKIWTIKTLERGQRNDTESYYRRATLLARLLDIYFILRSQWVRGPSQSLRWLQERDPDIYSAFAEALNPSANPVALAKLVKMIVDC